MKHTAIKLALAAAIALALVLPTRSANACGSYGVITDAQRIRWELSIAKMKESLSKPGLVRRITQVHVEGNLARAVVVDGWNPELDPTTGKRQVTMQQLWIDLEKRKSGDWVITAERNHSYFFPASISKFHAWTPRAQKFDLAREAAQRRALTAKVLKVLNR